MSKKDNGLDSAIAGIMGKSTDKPTEARTSPQEAPDSKLQHVRENYSGKTVTVAFRVRRDERERIEHAMKKHYGESLAGGLKRLVYDFLRENGY